ncbi:hypothetical protein GCM10029963_78650 [Micromonospora andamanensis]
MIFFDILVWLAVAKFAVLLLEDAAYAVRGKQSPRRQARARHQAAQQKTGDSGTSADGTPPAGGRRRSAGTTLGAADGYLAGLIEDATERARARRAPPPASAAPKPSTASWSTSTSRAAGTPTATYVAGTAVHTGSSPTRSAPAGSTPAPSTPTSTPANPSPPRPPVIPPNPRTRRCRCWRRGGEPSRPALRVIPGGAQDTPPARPVGPATDPKLADAAPVATSAAADQAPAPPRVRHEGHFTRCGRCGEVTGPTPTMPRHCFKCGAGDERLTAVTGADAGPLRLAVPPVRRPQGRPRLV